MSDDDMAALAHQQELENREWLEDFDKVLASDPAYGKWVDEVEAKNQEVDEMPFIVKAPESSGNFELVPEGTHLAVCDMVVNLGEQKSEFDGKVSFKPKCYLRFQIPSERIEIDGEDKPMVAGSTYNISLHEKATLRKMLEGWRGKKFTPDELDGFDISKLLGKPCQVSITHNVTEKRTYANINGIMALPKGMEAPKIEGEPLLYVDMIETPDAAEKLPKWIKSKLGMNVDDVSIPAPAPSMGRDFEDEIPF